MDNGNNIVFENKTVANKFNKCFCSIADKLVEKLEKRTFDGDSSAEIYKKKGVKPNAFSCEISKHSAWNIKCFSCSVVTGYAPRKKLNSTL